MKLPTLVVETLAEKTGLARDTIREVVTDIRKVLGDRLSVMSQRMGNIMASSSLSEAGQLDAVYDYADGELTTSDRARLFGALGLGFIGGYLLASAAGSLVVALVGLVLLACAGWLLMSMVTGLIERLSSQLERFKDLVTG